MTTTRSTTLHLALTAALLGCGGGSSTPMNTPDGGATTRPRDSLLGSRPPTMVSDPGEMTTPEENLPPDEMAAGAVTEGTDPVGSCLVTTVEGLDARLCVDYNDGYDAESAMAHCMGARGAFQAGVGCDRTNVRFVSTCSITEMMRTRVVSAYRIPATRTQPNPPELDAEAVATWCGAQMGTSPTMATPTNTGSCTYFTNENFLGVTMPGPQACINYDEGFTSDQARAECGGRTAYQGSVTFSERSCAAATATPGCRFRDGSRVWSVRYAWARRSATPWDIDTCSSDTRACFRRECVAAGGTFFTGP